MADSADEVINPLDLPDDELDAAFEAAMATEEVEESTDTSDVPGEVSDAVTEVIPPSKEEGEEEDESEEDESISTTEEEESTDTEEDESTDKETESKTPVSESSDIDYKTEYNKLLAPFKANGREVQIDSVDDAIQLMQMGANYNKKMAGLKPNLKLLKMLENHELLSEDKLSYLIDLSNKDPAAIEKLVKESGINPLDMDVEKDSEYQPKSYTVDDKEVELDGILDEIRDTDSYAKTIDVIGNKWDAASKKVLLGEPEIIRVINSHVESGIYDQIQSEIDKERMLGRINGLSDLEAYQAVGDAINARGGFKVQEAGPSVTSSEPKVLTKSKKSDNPDPKLIDKKKAAGPTKSASPVTAEPKFDPLSMSDEDFEKAASKMFKI